MINHTVTASARPVLLEVNQPRPNTGQSFETVLKSESDRFSLADGINTYLNDWQSASNSLNQAVSTLPGHFRTLMQVQIQMQQVHIRTEIAAKGGDAITGAMRRLESTGS